MARPRKATADLELSGAFKKDPKRGKAREKEPVPNGPIGEPPDCFDEFERTLWAYVVDLVPPRVLAKSDRLVLEVIVRMLRKLRQGTIRGAELSILTGCLSRLGLTPADRSRVTDPGKKDSNGEDDAFGSFLASEPKPGSRAN